MGSSNLRARERGEGGRSGRRSRMGLRALLGAAGRAVGRSRAERGTVLLMVIGVLAMMSIVALVYASIGQADRRSAAALVKETRLNDQAEIIADYIAGVIAADLFTYHEVIPSTGEERLFREVTDYPSSDPNAVSRNATGNQVLFDPAGYNGYDPWLAATEPGFIEVPGRTRRDPEYLNLEDWPHITNVSPDGRFVNLANLRNNFRAAPGTDGNLRQINSRLTLFNPLTGDAYNPNNSVVFLPDGTTRAADPNRPADWTQNQFMLHRPAVDIDRRGAAPPPGDPRYVHNQYADADGDGMLDSRWFELVGRDPNATNDLTRSLSPVHFTGPARYFVAARVIDLSGLVNVNTASEFTERPDRDRPAGLTPADVDLRRLLRMQDFYDYYGEAYDGLEPDPTERVAARQYRGNYDDRAAHELGDAAYMSLRLGREQGPLAPEVVLPYSRWTAEYRYNHYLRFGFDLHGGGPSGTGQHDRWFGRPFGVADELELRTRHGVNDPGTLSRLEAAVASRYTSAGTQRPLCPLRSTRSLDVEVGGRGDRWPTPQSLGATNFNGRADDEALLLAAVDIRRLLTTVSGSRPLRPVELDPNSPSLNELRESDVRLDLYDVLRDIAQGMSNADEQLKRLFATYATSLAPYLTGADNNAAWNDARYSTLFYGGRGPRLAIELAAHMTANAIDMFDRAGIGGDQPTALTINLVSGHSPVVPTGHRLLDLDAIDVPGQGVARRLNPGAAGPNEPTEIHVYGIEAQPFLTEMATFHLYTDTPVALGGDQEWNEITPGVYEGKVTIDGTINAANPDFVMQVIAIQVHNPFDEDIDLRGAQGGAPNYYFQFGDEYFRLSDSAVNTVLPAGGTRVFYTTNPSRRAINERWAQASPASSFDEWLTVQLGLRTQEEIEEAELERYKIPANDPVTWQLIDKDSYTDIFAAGGGAAMENRVVLLWRSFGDTATRADDILADRLRDPLGAGQGPTWDRRMMLADHTVANSAAGPEGTLDNTGLTVMFWGTVRRPDDPNGGNIPRGAIPAFCIERKSGTDPSTVNSLNVRKDDQVNDPNNLDIGNFGRNQAYRTFAAFVADQTAGPITDLLIARPPTGRRDAPPSGHPLGLSYDRVYPEIHLNNDQFQNSTGAHSTMRLGDALLPLAVGPKRYVGVTNPIPDPAPVNYLEVQWTTLSEALAIATGFENEQIMYAGDPWYRAGIDVLDRGHLRLEAFAPFYKNNPPSDYSNPWTYDEDAGDEMRYPGIPLAQHLLGQFRTLRRGNMEAGSERKLIPGLININTAPLAVLRLLPMFTPERDPNNPVTPWMSQDVGKNASGQPVPLYTPGSAGGAYDVAASVKAYRDKTVVFPRGEDFNDALPASGIDFQDHTVPGTPKHGRRRRTLIEGLREQPGFAGVGEILSVMQRERDSTGRPYFGSTVPGPGNLGSDLGNSPLRFGFPADPADPFGATETTAGILGIDSISYRTDPSNPQSPRQPDEIINDYDEQLTIANAVLNMIDTRSDVFCVWFVVHGYLPADVEGLADDEPMVPSIARRYIMVVDRSNVVRLGEKPRILLFQEVPL